MPSLHAVRAAVHRVRAVAVCAALVAIGVTGAGVLAGASPASGVMGDVEHRRILFPVDGPVSYRDDFGAPRSGHTHAGNDLMGTRMQRLVAVTDATVRIVRTASAGTAGNMVTIRDAQGWEYWYLHLNNDTPGSDDGQAELHDILGPGIVTGARVSAGQTIGYLGDSGNAEGSTPHLHFEIHRPDGSVINPYASLRLAQGQPVGVRCGYDTTPARPGIRSGRGYWQLGADGGIFTFGAAQFHGSMGGVRLNAPVVGLAATDGGAGYWEVATDGGIFAFGDAPFHGSTGDMKLNQPIVGMAVSRTGLGYWLVASDGGVFSFGDAAFHGSTGDIVLNSPVVDLEPTPTGAGYWMVAADGGIFAFGDARYQGSLPEIGAPGPAAGMALSDGGGYWIATVGGAIHAFGTARHYGAPADTGLCNLSIAAVSSSPTGRGYWAVSADGTVFALGDAVDAGDVTDVGLRLNAPMVDFSPM